MKKAAKETAKTTVKVGAKVGAEIIGTAAGKVVGDKLDRMDVAATNRGRVLKFFLDKMNAEHKQSDRIGKLVKDLFANRAKLFIMKAIIPVVSAFLGFFLLRAIACIPVVLVLALLYNSPFAMFLPPLEAGDTVLSVAKEYESDFNQTINQLVVEHLDCDKGDKIYVDYEGSAALPSNVYDVVAVYMVKHGIGDTATVMNDLSKQRLKTVFDDMCSYTTSIENRTTEQEVGTTREEKILHVNVQLKSYQDMGSSYHFTTNFLLTFEDYKKLPAEDIMCQKKR